MMPRPPINSAGRPYADGDVWTCECGATGPDRDDLPELHGWGARGCRGRRVFSVHAGRDVKPENVVGQLEMFAGAA